MTLEGLGPFNKETKLNQTVIQQFSSLDILFLKFFNPSNKINIP